MKVLNLGLGLPRHYFPGATVVNVDIWKPYLLGWKGHRICADADFLPIKPKSFDIVVSIDMLEHMTKKNGLKLVKEMEQVARKAVLFTTPWTLFKQDNLDGNPCQQHFSAYSKKDFPEYEFMIVPDAGLYFKAIE